MINDHPGDARAFLICQGATQKLAEAGGTSSQLHSRLDDVLADIDKKLEVEVSALSRKLTNEEPSTIYRLSDDTMCW